MRISLSGIAWDPDEDDAVAELLAAHRVDAIDVAPSKYIADLSRPDPLQVRELRQSWARRGIEITGMQSLLYGTTGLNMFGQQQVRHDMLDHLGHVMQVGADLGATRLVFGSPRNRDRGGRTDDEAMLGAVVFFRRLAERAAQVGVRIMLEPNPPRYGANFMTTAAEAAEVVRAVDHPAIGLQLDTGAAHLAGESVAEILHQHGDLVGHVHLSEPDLVPLGDGDVDHGAAAAALAPYADRVVAAIEMLRPQHEPVLPAIDRALTLATTLYRQQQRLTLDQVDTHRISS